MNVLVKKKPRKIVKKKVFIKAKIFDPLSYSLIGESQGDLQDLIDFLNLKYGEDKKIGVQKQGKNKR